MRVYERHAKVCVSSINVIRDGADITGLQLIAEALKAA